MNNQFKLFAANIILAAATIFAVGAAHADTTAPAQKASAKSTVVNYLSAIGTQASESYRAAR